MSCLLCLTACDSGGEEQDASPPEDSDIDGDSDTTDADEDDTGYCSSDTECDDGVFCNGEELCAPGDDEDCDPTTLGPDEEEPLINPAVRGHCTPRTRETCGGEGWVAGPPACGTSETWATCIWIPDFIDPTTGRCVRSEADVSRTQECR